MMIQSTEREKELRRKLSIAKNEDERKHIREELRAYLVEQSELYKDYPFAH